MKIPCFAPPSFEEVLAGHRARAIEPLAAARAEQGRLGGSVVAAVSLAGWMQEAAAAGIAHVPATVACEIPVATLMRFEDPLPEDMAHWKNLRAANASVGPTEMLRWDCCAGLALKMAMSQGNGPVQAAPSQGCASEKAPVWRAELHPDDPRFFDILMTYPGESMAVIRRPWVRARMAGTHPAEYRVYVQNGQVLGVANYYLQRDLAHNDQVHAEVERAIALSVQLLESMRVRRALAFNLQAGQLPDEFDPAQNSCTLDFLVDEGGEVLLLEGGPPFGLGAHPCAFMHNTLARQGSSQISVEGVCLALGQPVLPLAAFTPGSERDHGQRQAPRDRA